MSEPTSRSELPAAGRWSRQVMEYSVFVLGGLWAVNLVRSAVLDSTGGWGELDRLLAYLVYGCLLLAMVSGLVWAAVDLGHRVHGHSTRKAGPHPRRPPASRNRHGVGGPG